METIEKTGETVEEAIAAGLEELGVEPADVMVEVLEEPSRGLLGFGSRPARVRLVLMGGRRPSEPPPITTTEAPPTANNQSVPAEKTAKPQRESATSQRDRDYEDYDDEDDDVELPVAEEVADEDADEVALVAREVLNELLSKMEVPATVSIRRAEPTRQGEELHWVLNISGRNMNRLIGRRGETLAALQYITRLIVSRRIQRRANIIVDAAEYKVRRSERLKQLASRMAEQALKQHRVITLEPMPPHERRIVHLALRGRDDVVTRSVGEGNARKVTIAPSNL